MLCAVVLEEVQTAVYCIVSRLTTPPLSEFASVSYTRYMLIEVPENEVKGKEICEFHANYNT